MEPHSPIAPPHWRYSLFPLERDDLETIDIRLTSEKARELIRGGGDSDIGTVMHWAHIFKSEQSPEGDWPVIVNARTGVHAGNERTLAPAHILELLADMLNTTEFDSAIRKSAMAESLSTTGDRHDTTERTE